MLPLRYPPIDKPILRRFFNMLKDVPFLAIVRNRSYSQLGEDLLLASILKGNQGTYVDIGSGLPSWGNNTYMLYRKGWSGILVDPIARNIRKSQKMRRKDISILAAVGQVSGKLDFYEFEPYEYSTLSYDVYRERNDSGIAKFKRQLEVPVVTLNELFKKLPSNNINLLSIDVEGFEMEVLLGNNWLINRPSVICIEEWRNPIYEKTDVRLFLESKGYKLELYNGISSIYLIKDSYDGGDLD